VTFHGRRGAGRCSGITGGPACNGRVTLVPSRGSPGGWPNVPTAQALQGRWYVARGASPWKRRGGITPSPAGAKGPGPISSIAPSGLMRTDGTHTRGSRPWL
jgi:hypothetical protein